MSTEPTKAEWITATFFIYPAAFHLAVVKRVGRATLFQGSNVSELAMIGIGIGAGLICFSVGVYNAVVPQPPAAEVEDPCRNRYYFG